MRPDNQGSTEYCECKNKKKQTPKNRMKHKTGCLLAILQLGFITKIQDIFLIQFKGT